MPVWVYKVNSRKPDGGRDWHFDAYFNYRGREVFRMGGTGRIRSPMSWARLARVRKGDIFVCYQTDERKIYGFARTTGPGHESIKGSERFDSVPFNPGGIRLDKPVDVRWKECRELFQHIGAFTVPSRGTIHSLAPDEFRCLVSAVIKFNPKQAAKIRSYLKGNRA